MSVGPWVHLDDRSAVDPSINPLGPLGPTFPHLVCGETPRSPRSVYVSRSAESPVYK